MHHGYAITGTVVGGSSALVAQVETVRPQSGMPWWVPLACALVGVVPSLLAFVDKRMEARQKRLADARFDATVHALARPSIDRPDIPAPEPCP
jgi:hypothetical protein